MSVSDSVADFLTCVRNASKAKKKSVIVPASKMAASIAEIMKKEKFIKDFKVVEEENNKKSLHIYFKYLKDNAPAIKNIKKVSRPGLRRYVGVDEIPRVLNGLGIVIMSTSKGVITGKDACKQNVGGEIICNIW